MSYKQISDTVVQRVSDGAFIPADDGNQDYLDYLAWLDAGGVPQQPDLPSLDQAKAAELAAIDIEAGRARARYITIAPGQEATYLLKAAQAEAFKAVGYSGAVPGLVQAEIDATGATAQQATDAILAQQVAWEAKAAQIESARRRGKVAVGNAADSAAAETARAAAVAELVGL